jgi:hypothetical protein
MLPIMILRIVKAKWLMESSSRRNNATQISNLYNF